ncbi:hypothetical protein RSOL_309370, partial [Rhizoctonia solani AG-3 Rhs1AP]
MSAVGENTHFVWSPASNSPQVPSRDERELYYYGIPSKPVLIARSSNDLWKLPTGPKAYLVPKECSPVGMHRLCEVWENHIIPAMQAYLLEEGVQYTSLDPVRVGTVSECSPPVIIWVGVIPDSLSAEQDIKVATHCRFILTDHTIDDVHVEIRESQVTHSAKMYESANIYASSSIVQVVQSFVENVIGLEAYIAAGKLITYTCPRVPNRVPQQTSPGTQFAPKHPVLHVGIKVGLWVGACGDAKVAAEEQGGTDAR